MFAAHEIASTLVDVFVRNRVRRFWEKPGFAIVMIGPVNIFIDVLCQAVPNAMLVLSAGIVENDLDSSFRVIPNVDFSRDVRTSQPERFLGDAKLHVRVDGPGNPDRVLDTLKANK